MAGVNQASMGASESVTSAAADRLSGAFNQAPQTAKLLADTVGIPARTTDIPQAFPAIQNLLSFAALAPAAARRAIRGDGDEIGAAGPRGGYGDDDDNEIGAVGPRDGGEEEGEEGDDDGGGGGLFSFLSSIPIIGRLFSMFSGAMSRSRAGGCCNGSDCSQRMALPSRVPSLSNHAVAPAFNAPTSFLVPGFGPMGNNKS